MLFTIKNGQQLLVRGDAMRLAFYMGEIDYDSDDDSDLHDEG